MHEYSILRTLTLAAMLAVALSLIGCEREPPEPPPPPPPTPQEIAEDIINGLQLNQALPAPGSALGPGVAQRFKNAVTAAKREHSATPEGPEVLQIVSQRLGKRVAPLEQRKLWAHVLVYCEAYVILNPTSVRFRHTREKAIIEWKKPQVSIEGFFGDGNTDQTSVFMDFYIPIQGATYRETVRVGEEFYGLKMIAIIGKNHGVTMEYMETGETTDILYEPSSM